jgi:hypothetical protein
MITNPIVHPKVAILASLLVGALAITAFLLGPHMGQQLAEQVGFGHRDAASADAPDRTPPTALAWGRVAAQNQADADVAQVLDAVRASLRRNDLVSAKVLLGAERALYKDDPRIMALQVELQALEDAGGRALAVGPTGTSPAPVLTPAPSRASQPAPRYMARAEHTHSASSRIRERAGTPPEYAKIGHAPPAEAVVNPDVTRDTSSAVPANPEMDLTSLRAVPSAAEAPSPAQPSPAQSGTVPPPLTQAAPSAQSAQSAQPDSAPTPAPGTSSQAPKTRDEVRMEVERARVDGALPRFGNPDPAGPGGAPSRVSHAVVLDW